MSYEFRFLTGVDTHLLYETFQAAFSDYVQDVSGVTETNFVNRTIRGGVDLSASVGVYHESELGGFTLVAIDDFYGHPAAFDAMTGIIKAHRGKGLAKAIFEHAVPQLKEKGVQTFYLEVIQKNEPAVRAYEKTGFTINRELDAFELKFEQAQLDQELDSRIEIRPIPKSAIADCGGFFDWQPSWENSLASIQRVPDKVFSLGAFDQDTLVGILAHHPASNWILSLGVDPANRQQGIGTALLAGLKEEIGEKVAVTRMINVDHGDTGMIHFLKNVGFEFILNQYEMKLDI